MIVRDLAGTFHTSSFIIEDLCIVQMLATPVTHTNQFTMYAGEFSKDAQCLETMSHITWLAAIPVRNFTVATSGNRAG